ncbi:MAG: GapR family DNA-binding domain-containing protein [Alphaproteobacteria bacterium]
MSEATPSANTSAIQLSKYIERIERLEEEKRALMADIRDIYSEARATGFEPKIMRQIIKMRGLDKEVLAEQDILLSTYRAAVGLIEIPEKTQDI